MGKLTDELRGRLVEPPKPEPVAPPVVVESRPVVKVKTPPPMPEVVVKRKAPRITPEPESGAQSETYYMLRERGYTHDAAKEAERTIGDFGTVQPLPPENKNLMAEQARVKAQRDANAAKKVEPRQTIDLVDTLPAAGRVAGLATKAAMSPSAALTDVVISAAQGKTPEQKVAEAAKRADVRARVQEILQDEGMRAALGLGSSSTPNEVQSKLAQAGDKQAEEYFRVRASQYDSRQPPGKKLADDPVAREKVKADAYRDVAMLRTIGAWGPSVLSPLDRDKDSIIDAMKPTAEVVGIDKEGVPVVRSESPGMYLMDALTAPETAFVASGLPSAGLRKVFGDKPGAPEYKSGKIAGVSLPLDPDAIRERRLLMDVADEADVVRTTTKAAETALSSVVDPQTAKSIATTVVSPWVEGAVDGSMMAASILFPDAITLTTAGAGKVGFKLIRSGEEKLAKAADAVEEVAVKAGRARAAIADLLRKGAPESEVVEAIVREAKEFEKALYALPTKARDAIEDAARVRNQAERTAQEAAAAMGKTAKPYSATQLLGKADDAYKATVLAEKARETSRNARLGFGEGLKRVASLATTTGPKSPPLRPDQALAYAERLFDTAERTATELVAGARSAIKATAQPSAVAALIDTVKAGPAGVDKSADELATLTDALRKVRGSLSGKQRQNAERKLTERIKAASAAIVEKGIKVTPGQRTAFKDAAMDIVEQRLTGDAVVKAQRARQIVNEAVARSGAAADEITPRMLAEVDAAMRSIATEAAETARRASPLQSSAPAILMDESADRFRAVHSSVTDRMRSLARTLKGAFFAVYVGADELKPWAKEGLSKEARDWTFAAERRFDAIGQDVAKMTTFEQAGAYLTGKPPIDVTGLVADGMDRFSVFIRMVDEETLDLEQMVMAALMPPIRRPEVSVSAIMGKFKPEFQKALLAARDGQMTSAEFVKFLHDSLKPYAVADADLSGWTRVITGWIAANAEDVVLLNKGFGDGIVFTKEDVRAFNALSDGRFDAEVMRALDPSAMVERAVATTRMVGVGGMDAAHATIEGKNVQLAGTTTAAATKKTTQLAQTVGMYNEIMGRELYVPRMVRERMAAAIGRVFTPAADSTKSPLSWFKLAVTRGALTSKPGYLLNNMPGDSEQVLLACGFDTALKTAIRAEGTSVVGLVRAAVPGLAGAATQMALGTAAGGTARVLAATGVEIGLGVVMAGLAGKNKGALSKTLAAGGDVGERLGRKLADLLGVGSFRLEIGKVMEGDNAIVRIGDQMWTARELRMKAIEGGVYDSFDRAELVAPVGALAKWFQMPIDGVGHLAETISLRRRMGLYVTLIEDGIAPEQAARTVTDALFDYRAVLSESENKFLREVLLPFWSWQKSMNRLIVKSVTSPMGAYRMKVATSIGHAGDHMGAEAPSFEGDDIGLMTSYMDKDEQAAYAKFVKLRARVEAANPEIKPEQWNALILRSNPGVPESLEWAQHPGLAEDERLDTSDLAKLRLVLAPWYTPEMAKSYLRERTQFRGRSMKPADENTPTDYGRKWHVIAPHSGLDSGLQWFGTVTAGILSVGSPTSLGDLTSRLINPERAPILGPLIEGLQPGTGTAQRVAQGIAKPTVSQAIAKFMVNNGLGDGTWLDYTPGFTATDKFGKVTWNASEPVSVMVNMTPGLSDINRQMLAAEGADGGTVSPDALQLAIRSFGFSTPMVDTIGALYEVRERDKWVEETLGGFQINRDEDGKPAAR